MQPFEHGTNDRRQYRRATHFDCTVRVSADGTDWLKADVENLSSGGLFFVAEDEFDIGDLLCFDLDIGGFMSDIEIKTKGKVRYKKQMNLSNKKCYGIQFIGLSEDKRIRIDECILGDRPITGETYNQD